MPDNDSVQGDVVASGSNAGDDAVQHTAVSAGSQEGAASPAKGNVVTPAPKAGDVVAGAKLEKVTYSDSLHTVWSGNVTSFVSDEEEGRNTFLLVFVSEECKEHSVNAGAVAEDTHRASPSTHLAESTLDRIGCAQGFAPDWVS